MFRYIHRHFLLLPRILLTLRHSTKRRADIYSPWFSGHRAICALQYKTKRENIKGLYLYFILFILFILFSFHMDWLTLAICFFCCCVYMCALSPSRFSLPYILWTNYSDPRKVWRPALLPYYLSLFLVSVCDAGCFVYYVYHEPREEDEAAAQQLQRRETKQPNDPQEKEKKKRMKRERERDGSLHFLLLLLCVLKKKNVYERREALTQSFVNDTQHRQSISKLIRKVSDDTSAAITITTRPSSPSLYFLLDIFLFSSLFLLLLPFDVCIPIFLHPYRVLRLAGVYIV